MWSSGPTWVRLVQCQLQIAPPRPMAHGRQSSIKQAHTHTHSDTQRTAAPQAPVQARTLWASRRCTSRLRAPMLQAHCTRPCHSHTHRRVRRDRRVGGSLYAASFTLLQHGLMNMAGTNMFWLPYYCGPTLKASRGSSADHCNSTGTGPTKGFVHILTKPNPFMPRIFLLSGTKFVWRGFLAQSAALYHFKAPPPRSKSTHAALNFRSSLNRFEESFERSIYKFWCCRGGPCISPFPRFPSRSDGQMNPLSPLCPLHNVERLQVRGRGDDRQLRALPLCHAARAFGG